MELGMKTPTDHHHIVTKTLNNETLNSEALNNDTLNNVRPTRMDMVLSQRSERPCCVHSLMLN
jgi:hypothetical protein